jgi:Amidohydrolase
VRLASRILFSSLFLLAAASRLAADRFDDAYAKAQANLATPEGRALADRLAARFDEKTLRDALTRCAESLPPEDAPPFTMLMELTADGRPSQILLRPPAPVAVCLRWVVREETLPRPPAPGYWISVELDPRRAPGAPVIPTPGVATATVPPTRTPSRPGPPPAPPASSFPVPLSPTPVPPRGTPPPASAVGIHVDPMVDLSALRRSLAGTPGPIGPLLSQSDGIPADDGRLEPYWSLAEELDRPIAIALGPAPSAAPVPNYRVALGDPMTLEPVLARHPRLRVIVVGAGWPFGDAMVGVMKRYAQVSVDIRPLFGALPDAELQAYVRRLADAGFVARIVGN